MVTEFMWLYQWGFDQFFQVANFDFWGFNFN